MKKINNLIFVRFVHTSTTTTVDTEKPAILPSDLSSTLPAEIPSIIPPVIIPEVKASSSSEKFHDSIEETIRRLQESSQAIRKNLDEVSNRIDKTTPSSKIDIPASDRVLDSSTMEGEFTSTISSSSIISDIGSVATPIVDLPEPAARTSTTSTDTSTSYHEEEPTLDERFERSHEILRAIPKISEDDINSIVDVRTKAVTDDIKLKALLTTESFGQLLETNGIGIERTEAATVYTKAKFEALDERVKNQTPAFTFSKFFKYTTFASLTISLVGYALWYKQIPILPALIKGLSSSGAVSNILPNIVPSPDTNFHVPYPSIPTPSMPSVPMPPNTELLELVKTITSSPLACAVIVAGLYILKKIK